MILLRFSHRLRRLGSLLQTRLRIQNLFIESTCLFDCRIASKTWFEPLDHAANLIFRLCNRADEFMSLAV